MRIVDAEQDSTDLLTGYEQQFGSIVNAVKRSIEEDSDDCWYIYLKAGSAHHLHVSTRCSPDGWDHDIMRRLAGGGQSLRAGMTHVDRRDGSIRPWLILHDERRVDPKPMIGGRRISDPVAVEKVGA